MFDPDGVGDQSHIYTPIPSAKTHGTLVKTELVIGYPLVAGRQSEKDDLASDSTVPQFPFTFLSSLAQPIISPA